MYKKHPIPRSKFIFLPQTTSACNIPRFLKEPSELIETFLRSQTMHRLRGNRNEFLERVNADWRERAAERRLPQQVPGEFPGARDAPNDELPQARRAWMVSRREIMMGREFQIAQYRGFLHELHERSADRAANNGRVVAPPEVVDDSSSEEEFDIDDYDMSLP
ncbi:hypothetical protein BGAL_0142g00040 [Botrytis galanthina]|uniref:Uncharacterized protein n=1 Tax=Botrytis galanthina TaxID=278940 RepID=A0A4S8R3E8_9HELO|nr:hypothetical protein BGAL_0142g00040 [Botrytis galanthina]